MNILFNKHFICMIYSFCNTDSVRFRALSIFGYFPLIIYSTKYKSY